MDVKLQTIGDCQIMGHRVQRDTADVTPLSTAVAAFGTTAPTGVRLRNISCSRGLVGRIRRKDVRLIDPGEYPSRTCGDGATNIRRLSRTGVSGEVA